MMTDRRRKRSVVPAEAGARARAGEGVFPLRLGESGVTPSPRSRDEICGDRALPRPACGGESQGKGGCPPSPRAGRG